MLGFLALAMQELSELPTDGRAARAIRTRGRVVDALLDLIQEGDVRPSAAEVARRAGVSLRSVYQHFEDLEALFQAAGERHRERVAHLEPLPELPADLASRVAAYTAHRARWLEAVTPMNRAAALQAPFSKAIADRQAAGRARLRAGLKTAFAPELGRAAEPDRLLHALEAAAAWTTWEGLRAGAGLPGGEAERVVELLLLRLLEGVSSGASRPRSSG
jgi:TetR/AcrR family transcriptional regulator, regulator of autoinduction and epiphytic fitness